MGRANRGGVADWLKMVSFLQDELLSQLQTQVQDLERYIDFLRGKEHNYFIVSQNRVLIFYYVKMLANVVPFPGYLSQ